MSNRTVVFGVVFLGLLLVFILAVKFSSSYYLKHPSSSDVSVTSPTVETARIQTKASVVQLNEPGGFTMVGIMAAYEPKSRSFWWRPMAMIAEPSQLESLYERCKFAKDGGGVVSFCVMGNNVTILTTKDSSDSLEQGLQKAETALRENPSLMNGYSGPRDMAFDLRQKTGIDMNTPEGVRPTVVQSVTNSGSGFLVAVSCGCGDGELTLNRNYDFVNFKKKS